MKLQCVHCGAGLELGPLYRQNPKGEDGILACASCSTVPIDAEVKEISEIIHGNKENYPSTPKA